jgi:hypothetical protein
MATSDGYLKDPASIRVPVPKRVIVDRRQATGKLAAARAALDAADLYTRERWHTRAAIHADDAAARALLQDIGAVPDETLALE